MSTRPRRGVWRLVMVLLLAATACGSSAPTADAPAPADGYARRAAAQLEIEAIPKTGGPDELWGRTLDLPLPAPDFALTATDGSTFDFARDADAPVTLLYFGYASCPDVCPAHMAAIGRALDALTADQRDRVDVLFVSVDPTVDTPQRLGSYLDAFGADITGLTGTPGQVNAALASLGLPPTAVVDDAGEPPRHPSSVLGYTLDGQARVAWPFGTTPDMYAHDLRLLLDETGDLT